MKKNIITITALILIIISLVSIGAVAFNRATKVNAYTRTAEGVIVEVDNEVVAVETTDGHVWEFKGEGYTIGQTVKVVFSNNGSPDFVKDDVIQWVG